MNLTLSTRRLKPSPLSPNDPDISLEMFTDPDVAEYLCDLMAENKIRREMSNWIRRGSDGPIGICCSVDRVTGEKYGSVLLLRMPMDKDDADYDLLIPGQTPHGPIELG